MSLKIFISSLYGGEPGFSHLLRRSPSPRLPCSHFLKDLFCENSSQFTTWFVIDSHFSFNISASPWQVSMLQQGWFVFDGIHELNFSHPFFFDDAHNFFLTFFIAFHGSIWCFFYLSGPLSCIFLFGDLNQ